MIVASALQGRGLGRALLHGLHEAARQRGRSLVLLNTRRGDRAERFYRGLGYQEAGVIPGYSLGPDGEVYDNLLLYRRLTGEEDSGASSAGPAAAPPATRARQGIPQDDLHGDHSSIRRRGGEPAGGVGGAPTIRNGDPEPETSILSRS